jgi:hypothetical protein
MSVPPFDSSYQREPGFRRLKSKASGRSLANPDVDVQIAAHLHLRAHAQGKLLLQGTESETLYVLLVSWLNGRAFLDLRRVGDGCFVVHTVAETEGEAWKLMKQQIKTLGL